MLRELDLSWCEFRNSTIFWAIMQNMEHSKIFNFKLRGFQIGKVEGKIMQKFVLDCKNIQSLDL